VEQQADPAVRRFCYQAAGDIRQIAD
jgi:hypothetical protein